MPFFSVIIPTYNRANELKHSLESVLSQSYTDLELIVVDDGSTDNTAAVVSAYEDARIKYVFQENSERSATRNNGMKVAEGRYICFLDSDDIFYKEHLQVLYDRIQNDGFPVAIYKTMMNYADKSRPDDLSFAYRGNDQASAVRYVWYNGSQIICLCLHNEIGKEVLFPEQFFWFEDIHWITRVVMKYPLKQVMRHTTRYNNMNSVALLPERFNKYLVNCEACIRDLEHLHGEELKAILGSNCFDVKVAELYLGLIVSGAIRTKQPELGYSYLRKAIRLCVTPKLTVKYLYYFSKLLRVSVFG